MAARRRLLWTLVGGLALTIVVAVAVAGGIAVAGWRHNRIAVLEPAAGPLKPSHAPDPGSGGLLILGDSRAAGWQPLPRRPWPVRVRGYWGESAVRMAPGFGDALDASKPEAVLVVAGANDVVALALSAQPDDPAALAPTLAAFRAMAATARARGTPFAVLAVTPPDRVDPVRSLLFRGRDKAFAARLNRELAAMLPTEGGCLIDPSALLTDASGKLKPAFRADWIHFTPAAYHTFETLLPHRPDGLCSAPDSMRAE